MQRSESVKELAVALVKAQSEVKPATKSAQNPHLKNKYATLADVWDAARPVLAKHGLSVVQGAGEQDDAGVAVSTLLLHTSGEWIESTLRLPLEKPTAQAVGSAISYGRRYGLMSILGIVADDDDDGHSAAQAAPAAARPAAPRQAQPLADPRTVPTSTPNGVPPGICPKCDTASGWYDNRTTKTNPRQPDYKCKNKSCGNGVWLSPRPVPAAAQAVLAAFDDEPPPPDEPGY